MFICIQKMNSIPNLFLRYCKDIANLLHWVLWECLIMSINNDSITLSETLMPKILKSTLMFICMQKINFNFVKLDIVVKTLQTFYFGNFGNDWASQSKNQLHHTSFSKYCKEIANVLFLGNLGMSGHAHLKQ